MQSVFTYFTTTPSTGADASAKKDGSVRKDEIPSDWESGGSKGVTCVVSKEETEIPSEWESGGSKGVTCVVA
jgi:hypothetical protein